MIHLPPIPPAISSDYTEWGQYYYTRKQLQEYGHACALAMLIDQAKPKSLDVDLDSLKRMFGITA